MRITNKIIYDFLQILKFISTVTLLKTLGRTNRSFDSHCHRAITGFILSMVLTPLMPELGAHRINKNKCFDLTYLLLNIYL